MVLTRVSLVGALLLSPLLACNDPTYLPEVRQLTTSATSDGGMPTIADDEQRYGLPLRRPTSADRQQLSDEEKKLGLPQRVPWVGVRDLPLEILLTVTNQDMVPARAFVTLVGASEFGAYDPGAFVDPTAEEQVPPPPLLGNAPIDLAPGETRQLVYREDDVAEAALDVEAIVRYPSMPATSTPFKVLSHRSEDSNVGFENVPANDVTPQLVELTIRLHSEQHVTCDYSVRVRDLHGRLSPDGLSHYP